MTPSAKATLYEEAGFPPTELRKAKPTAPGPSVLTSTGWSNPRHLRLLAHEVKRTRRLLEEIDRPENGAGRAGWRLGELVENGVKADDAAHLLEACEAGGWVRRLRTGALVVEEAGVRDHKARHVCRRPGSCSSASSAYR